MVDALQTAILAASALAGMLAIWLRYRERRLATLERNLEAVALALGQVFEALIDASAITGVEPRFSVAKAVLKTRLALVPQPLPRCHEILTTRDVPGGKAAADWDVLNAAVEEVAQALAAR
jgi:hypothetical protein